MYEEIDFTRFLEVPERVWDLVTMGQLLEQFYRCNPTDYDLRFYLAFQLDPIGFSHADATYLNTFYAILRGRFFVTVTIDPRNHHGFHRMRLWYRCEQAKASLWIATAQSNEGYFFNEECIQASIYRATRLREWFQTSRESKSTVIA